MGDIFLANDYLSFIKQNFVLTAISFIIINLFLNHLFFNRYYTFTSLVKFY